MVPGPMTASAPPKAAVAHQRAGVAPLRVAYLGDPQWLRTSCPPLRNGDARSIRIPLAGGADHDRALADVARFAPQISVVFDAQRVAPEVLRRLPGASMGILVDAIDAPGTAATIGAVDRAVSFVAEDDAPGGLWRAIPPPVADELFGDVRPLHGRPAAMAIGRATEHREWMLLPAKHAHDLFHAVHGLGGDALAEVLREYDVGVYTPPEPEGAVGAQAGIHLAAGQLLLADRLEPRHGLEAGIDFVRFDGPTGLVWTLDRIAQYPEMYQRVRVRGRMKAEGFRASAVFTRVLQDLLADIAAFGAARR